MNWKEALIICLLDLSHKIRDRDGGIHWIEMRSTSDGYSEPTLCCGSCFPPFCQDLRPFTLVIE